MHYFYVNAIYLLSCWWRHGKLHSNQRRKRSYVWNQKDFNTGSSFGSEKSTCRARFQQSPVEVYAKFIASDQVLNLYITLL